VETNAGIIRSRAARYIYVAVAVVLALLLRVALAERSITLPTYITFYPVVFLAALLGGISEGILATALSALLADYFLLPPFGSFAIHSVSDIVAMVIFCAAGITASVVAGLYQRSRERRAAHAIESAILSERENVEEAGELTETARAECQRFLGVLETLRAASDSTVSPSVSPISRIFSASGSKSKAPTLDQKRFRASLRLTVWVPFIAALILAGAAFWAAYNLYSSMQWLDHTDQVIAQSRRLLKLQVDMETGERGYLVTGNSEFLQPYQEALKVIESEYQKLYLLVADDPPQQIRLEKLHTNLLHWQGYAEQMIALRRTGGAYEDLQANLAGKAEVDEIRDRIAGFQSVEQHVRDERNRTAQRDWRLVATICILLGLGMGVGLAVFAFRRIEIIAASFEESGSKLAATLQRFYAILSNLNSGVLLVTDDGRIEFANPAFCGLFGLTETPDELRANFDSEKLIARIDTAYKNPAQGVPRVREIVARGQSVFSEEIQMKNGATLLRDFVPLTVDGKPYGRLWVHTDITEAKRAEEFRQSSQYARSLLEASLDPLVTISPEGKITDVNEAAIKATGVVRDRLVGTDFADYFTEPDKARKGYQRVFSEGFVTDYPLTIRHADGRLTEVLYNASVYKDDRNNVLGVFAAARDVTERKQAEAALQESETKFRTLSDLVPQFVWMCTPDGLNVYFNQRWVEYTGLTLEESYGRGWNTPFHPDDKQAAWDAWNHAVATGDIYRVESRLRAADGTYRWFLMRGTPLQDDSGEIAKWFGTCTDIDDLKRAEAELAARAQELARSNADLQQFAYVASHDLQEPLRTISSFSQLLARRYQGKLDSDADDFIAFMVDGAMRMQNLINDLLAFSRIGTQGSSFAPTDCEKILHSAEENLKAAIEESGAVITHDSLPRLVADERQLIQLFQNLLSNAIKFRRPEIAPRIHVSSKWQNGAWKLSIRDNGIGIDPHYFDRIFIIFQRLHGREQYTGTGIGLAVCKKIVERHGGRLWVESESGTGSIFHFVIPGESNIGEGSLYDESRQRN
jgi:PAS domain S-box-containing protein